jgi:hypothetical protein
MRIKKSEVLYFAILLFVLVLIFVLNIVAGGTITSPQNLAIDLASPPNSPQDWLIQNWVLVKYRALFRLIVRGTWSLFFAPTDAVSFYAVFVAWSFVFFYGALIAFYYYLRVLDFDRRTSFIGCLLFLTAPPVLLAYKYPVYTREDVLAYFLVILGLIAIFKSRPALMSVIAAAGALTRETTLIVPLVYLWASDDAWRKRIAYCIPPFIALIGVRLLWGFSNGNALESSILNFLFPGETLAFLFCVFGVLWLPYLIGLHDHWQRRDSLNYAWKVLTVSGPFIVVLVIGAAMFLARAREIRSSFIIFPWAIPFALDWFQSRVEYFARLIRNNRYWIFAFSILALLSAGVLMFHLANPGLMRDILADFKNGYWLVIGTLNLSATLAIFLPMLYRRRVAQGISLDLRREN